MTVDEATPGQRETEPIMTGYRGVTRTRSFSFYERDLELIDWCSEFLGCKKSEVVRTAVRNLSAQLASLKLKDSRNGPN